MAELNENLGQDNPPVGTLGERLFAVATKTGLYVLATALLVDGSGLYSCDTYPGQALEQGMVNTSPIEVVFGASIVALMFARNKGKHNSTVPLNSMPPDPFDEDPEKPVQESRMSRLSEALQNMRSVYLPGIKFRG